MKFNIGDTVMMSDAVKYGPHNPPPVPAYAALRGTVVSASPLYVQWGPNDKDAEPRNPATISHVPPEHEGRDYHYYRSLAK